MQIKMARSTVKDLVIFQSIQLKVSIKKAVKTLFLGIPLYYLHIFTYCNTVITIRLDFIWLIDSLEMNLKNGLEFKMLIEFVESIRK